MGTTGGEKKNTPKNKKKKKTNPPNGREIQGSLAPNSPVSPLLQGPQKEKGRRRKIQPFYRRRALSHDTHGVFKKEKGGVRGIPYSSRTCFIRKRGEKRRPASFCCSPREGKKEVQRGRTVMEIPMLPLRGGGRREKKTTGSVSQPIRILQRNQGKKGKHYKKPFFSLSLYLIRAGERRGGKRGTRGLKFSSSGEKDGEVLVSQLTPSSLCRKKAKREGTAFAIRWGAEHGNITGLFPTFFHRKRKEKKNPPSPACPPLE